MSQAESVRKHRAAWYAEHGFSYQAMVKWVNKKAVITWGQMNEQSRDKWLEAYKRENGYG